MPYTYDYPRPAFTADLVVCRLTEHSPRGELLLIQRGQDPFAGQWALPGGFVNELESSLAAARRELAEETGLDLPPELELLPVGAYDTPGRDPRGWVVTIAYAVLLPSHYSELKAGDDAAALAWFSLDELPLPLAFDHEDIVTAGIGKLITASEGGTGFPNTSEPADARPEKLP